MRRTIEAVIQEMEGKLSGYCALLNYRYMNLCVKAEPMALLSIQLEDENGELCNLESMADAMLSNKYQFEVVPKKSKDLFIISKGFKEAHPEFEQEIVTPDDKSRFHTDQDDEKHIIYTMPVVNSDRHDFLMDAVKTLHDQCKVQVDKVNAAYPVKLASKLIGLPEEEVEEAKKKMEDSQNTYFKICDDYMARKQQEIEDAYQHYLEEQAAKNAKEEEIAATRINRSSNSMQMGHYEE